LDPRLKGRLLHENLKDTITVKDIIQGVEVNLVKFYDLIVKKAEDISTETVSMVNNAESDEHFVDMQS
jgi:hypothetical protein